MRYSSRFFLYAPLALLLALTVLVAAHWWRTANVFEARLAALKGHEAVPGVTLDWAHVAVSGFPFRMDATFDGFVAQGTGAHGPFTWRSEHFALHALTYGARKAVFEAAGNQHLSWSDAAGAAHSIDFLPGLLRASAVRGANGLSRFDVDGMDLAGQNSGNGDFSIGHAQFHMRRDPDGKSIDLMAAGDAVKTAGPLGGARVFRVYQTLSQSAAFAGLLAGKKAAPEAHALWLLAGGKAGITQAELNGKKNALTPEQRQAAITLLSPLY
jgi:hypothetical protein